MFELLGEGGEGLFGSLGGVGGLVGGGFLGLGEFLGGVGLGVLELAGQRLDVLLGSLGGVGVGVVGFFLGLGDGLIEVRLGGVAVFLGLAHGLLLFLEGLLDLGEGLGGIGLGGVDAGVGDAGNLLGAGGEGRQESGAAGLRVLEGLEFGGDRGFDLGDAFGGRLRGARGLGGGGGLVEGGLGGGDLGVGGGEGLGDVGLGGFDGLGGVLRGAGFDLVQQGLAAGFQCFEGRGALGLLSGGVGDCGGNGHLSFARLGGGLGVGVLGRGGGLGLVEELLEAGNLLSGVGFLLGEGLLHLGGGVLHGGDVSLHGAGGARVFAVGGVLQFLEFIGVAFGDRGVIGAGELGQRDDDRLAAETVAQAVLGVLEGGLKVADFAFVATLADLELVVGAAIEAHFSRSPAGSHAIEADGRTLRVRINRNDLNEGRVDRRRASGDGGTEDKDGNRDTHGFGV